MSIKSKLLDQVTTLFSVTELADARRAESWLADRVAKSERGVFAEEVMVTPALCEFLLARNDNNRPVSRVAVERYARQMTAGVWELTGETLVISKSGRLLNGQHRCHAGVQAAVDFRTLVVFGIDDAAFAYMDIGRKRSSGDVFTIYGVPNATAMAAATLWLWRHEAGVGEGAARPGNEELYEYYMKHQDLQRSVNSGWRFTQYKLAPPTMCTALHYLCAQKNREMADAFFERTATGIGLEKGDPALILRNRLVANRTGSERLVDEYISAFFIKAWNAWRQRMKLSNLSWRATGHAKEDFPRIV